MNESYDWLFKEVKPIEQEEVKPIKRPVSKSLSETSDIYWEMANGELIDIKKMTTPHIHNCLRLLKENGSPYSKFREHWEIIFEKELVIRQFNELNTDYSL